MPSTPSNWRRYWFLHGFIRAGSQGNDFELVEPYDVTTRTLKFPILEKPFCALRDPGQRLQRARVLSNRQFRLATYHAELMARLRSRETPQNTHHVVLGAVHPQHPGRVLWMHCT